MIRQMAPEEFRDTDFVPQAVIGRPPSYFVSHLRINLIRSADDLDEYEGAVLTLNDRTPFVLRHYRGHRDDTTTIYLPVTYRDGDEITRIVKRLLRELKIDRRDLVWQRADNPEL
jgi:hypothetical protein